ncbi:RNA-guided endonuclease InsQ/TnpB family protein [Arthrobacter cavernae]|uniref:Transposase n=1 Tax=Arthrobacter cavernae TaxID=2817681 RepID=A0A939HM11_9MICC|nr:RNA-guided endonuclease TnpB family protein [Arthrobacter cavernae]MBO1269753.1 transposase [Arthrobacter cavernae]
MSIRQRLYPTAGQAAGLMEHCHHARFVFNIGLEQRSMWRRDKHLRGPLSAPRVNTATQMRELAELRGEAEWLRAGSSSVQQAALRDLDRAFGNFFAGRAKYPKFKRRSDREGSFVIRDLSVRRLNRKWGEVMVPKIGRVRFRISRDWVQITSASSARVTHQNGAWHVAFTTPAPARRMAATGAAVGIDRDVANTLALSDGRMFQAPSLTTGEQSRFVRLQQRLSRQQKDSRRRGKTLEKLAVLRRRLEARRSDWLEQTTTTLARTHGLIAVEDLRIRNMVRRPKPKPDPETPTVFLPNGARAKAGLNRAILASAWGRFLTRLEHKMPEGNLLRVDPKNTSRTCAACGHCAPGNRESQAVFECQACGHEAHADTNAAIVILDRALRTTTAAGHAVSGRTSPASAGSANQLAA